MTNVQKLRDVGINRHKAIDRSVERCVGPPIFSPANSKARTLGRVGSGAGRRAFFPTRDPDLLHEDHVRDSQCGEPDKNELDNPGVERGFL